MDACIKNIDETMWRTFREESIRHGLKSGEFFDSLVKNHVTECKGCNTEKIRFGPKPAKGILSQSEYLNTRNRFRSSMGLRNDS